MINASKILIGFLIVISTPIAAQKQAKVIHVSDGDTYHLQVGNKIINARLTNVDAPEKSQQYGGQTKKAVSDLLLGKTVLFDSIETDKYKRVLVKIWIDGKALDSTLIRNGWAWVYTAYCKDANLANLQKMAIRERKGLWQCGPLQVCPPWIYRKYNYTFRMRYCSGCR